MTFDPNEPRGAGGRWTHLAGLMKSAGGFTHDLASGTEPVKGYSVGVPAPGGKDWRTLPHGSTSSADLAKFARDFKDELSKPNRGIGGWSNHNPEWGEVRDALDVVEVHQDKGAALKAARKAGQDAIYDLSAGEEIPVPKDTNLSVYTPSFEGEYDLSGKGGQLAFWKQILPKGVIHYTAKDGSRQTLNFDDDYLHDLANNQAKDSVDFMLADTDNRHTMDPERWRGTVKQFEVRENGLWGKIVFPNQEAAKAVLDNPELGVSARIREGIQRSDGTTISRGIIHVLGTLDPQVSGMAGWQQADLSATDEDVLDLSNEAFEEKAMAKQTKAVTEFTDEEIEAMSEDELDSYIEEALSLLDGSLDEDEVEDDLDEDESEDEKELVDVGLSNEQRSEIDLARSEARQARKELAQARWERDREAYLAAGVPPHLLDLSEPVLNRPDEMIVDLSNTDGADAEVDVSKVVKGLLDAAKGTIDLSAEQGHGGTFKSGDGEDPDKALLDAWDNQF